MHVGITYIRVPSHFSFLAGYYLLTKSMICLLTITSHFSFLVVYSLLKRIKIRLETRLLPFPSLLAIPY